MKREIIRDEMSRVAEAVAPTIEWSVDVTQGQFVHNSCHSSDPVVVDGFIYRLKLWTNDSNRKHFGLYLLQVPGTNVPDWWPCHVIAVFKIIAVPQRLDQLGITETYIRFGRIDRKFVFVDLPRIPPDAGLLANDIQVSLKVEVSIVHDSLTSLCMAFACFHPRIWHDLSTDDLSCILELDALPVTSEDEVLKSLLKLDKHTEELEQLLKHVRWKFVATHLLFESCRLHNARSFRNCQITKDALSWLLGQSGEPKDNCIRSRKMYKCPVAVNHPVQSSAIVDWLVSEPSTAIE